MTRVICVIIMNNSFRKWGILAGLITVPYFCRSFSINLSVDDNVCYWYRRFNIVILVLL